MRQVVYSVAMSLDGYIASRAKLRLAEHQLYAKTGTVSPEYGVSRKPAGSKLRS